MEIRVGEAVVEARLSEDSGARVGVEVGGADGVKVGSDGAIQGVVIGGSDVSTIEGGLQAESSSERKQTYRIIFFGLVTEHTLHLPGISCKPRILRHPKRGKINLEILG